MLFFDLIVIGNLMHIVLLVNIALYQEIPISKKVYIYTNFRYIYYINRWLFAIHLILVSQDKNFTKF